MQLARSAHVDTFCRDNLPSQELWPQFLREVPEVDYPERLNCATALLDAVIDEHGAGRPCLLAPDGTAWSYGDLLARANALAHLLVEDFGLVPGNRVLLRGPNNPGLVALWFAVLKAGGVVVPTMPMLRAGELRAIAEIARVDLAVCDHRFADDLEGARIPDLRILLYGGGPGSVEELAADKPATFDDVDTAADDVSMLAFTSGTTGRPKATMHFHRDVLANADTFSRYVLRPTRDDVFTGTPPIAFTFGLGGLVVFPLRVGASTLLVEKATPAELAGHIEAHGVTVCFTAPTAYKAMLVQGAAPRLRSLRRAVSAGEHLPRATWQEFRESTGVALIDGIGSTEMLHIFISAADDDIRPGSTGRPVPGFRAQVVDVIGRPVPDGTPGRLAVQGPTGCRYLADERQTVYVQDGWNITGDTFIRDEDGYFWYQARSDDMIVSSGYNISGTEVEEALSTHPDVLESAVVAHPDEERGHVVKAYVVLVRGRASVPSPEAEAVKAKELQDHVKATIAPYKYPRRVEFIDALPRTSTGKVQRYQLRRPPDLERHEPAAVDVEHHPGDIGRLGAGQEQDRADGLAQLGEPAQRDGGQHLITLTGRQRVIHLLETAGEEQARGDRVDPDAARTDLAGQPTGEPEHRRLGRGIRHTGHRGGLPAADRAAGDDRTTGRHQGDRGLGAVERALDVDVDDEVDVLGLDLLQGAGRAERAAGQRDEHVQAAQLVVHPLHRRAHRSRVADVQADAEPAGQAAGDGAADLLVHVEDRDRCTLGGERLADGAPDAAGAAGDHRDPPVEAPHRPLPFR